MQLHPKAAENINKKAEELLGEFVEELTPKPAKSPKEKIDIHVSAKIEPVGDIISSRTDLVGNEVSRWFYEKGKIIKLEGEAYKKFRKLTQGVQRTPDFKESVSHKTVSNLTFDWLMKRYRGAQELSLADFLIANTQKLISDREIWIPIAHTRILYEFEFAGVEFKTITREMIDEWEAKTLEQVAKEDEKFDPNLDPKFKALFDRHRKRMLGFAAVVVKLKAELNHAYEIASEKAEESVGYLRCIYPGNMFPFYVSHSVPLGSENLSSYQYLSVKGGQIVGSGSGVNANSFDEWTIDIKNMSDVEKRTIAMLSDLVQKKSKTDFEKEVLKYLYMYSKSSLYKNFEDRLTYILLAVEGLLRSSPHEPEQAIAERLAVMNKDNLEVRKEFLAAVLKVYELRFSSSDAADFRENEKAVKNFLTTIWMFITNVVHFSQQFETKEAFISAIDNKIFSGGLE